jgi:hypothetical protein
VTSRWRYVEDRVGVTPMRWLYVVAPVLAQVVLIVVTPPPVWGTALGVALMAEVCAVILLREGWKTGIRVSDDEVRIGGCRRAERLAAKGRPAKAVIDPHFRLRSQFVIPVAAIRSATVLRRPEFDQLPGLVVTPAGPGEPVIRDSLVDLVTPLATAALVLLVDLEHAQMPAMATYMTERFVRVRTSSRYAVTNRWTISTRHPEALAAALTAVGVPVVPSDASGLEPQPRAAG